MGAGAGTVTVTAAVSDSLPSVLAATTRKAPAVFPAVYNPCGVMVPPVAEKAADADCVLPSLIMPVTENCCVPPAWIETDAGAINS